MPDPLAWLPPWLQTALTKPTMPVPQAGRAVFNAGRGKSYELARVGVIPTNRANKTMEVPTVWVRRQLLLDSVVPDESPSPRRRLHPPQTAVHDAARARHPQITKPLIADATGGS